MASKKEEATVTRRRVVAEEPAKEPTKKEEVVVQEPAKTEGEKDTTTTQMETQFEDPAGGESAQDDPEAQASPSSPSSLEAAEAPPAASGSPHAAQLRLSKEVTEEDMQTVFASVPKAFKLRVTGDVVLDIEAGAQKLERFITNHWYSKANGVVVVE